MLIIRIKDSNALLPADEFLNIIYSIGQSLPKPFLSLGARLVEWPLQKYAHSLRAPGYLYLYITNQCNARCAHCYFSEQLNVNPESIDLLNIEQIFKSYRGNIRVLHLTGGEPFLYRDIDKIAEIASKCVDLKKINIPTNGFLVETINEKVEDILKCTSSNLNISVSLDGLGEIHDRMRGVKGIFSKAIDTLKNIKKLSEEYPRLSVNVLTTISTQNYQDLSELKSYLAKLGISHGMQFARSSRMVYGCTPVPVSGFDPDETEILSLKKMESVIEDLLISNSKSFNEKISNLTNQYFIETIASKTNDLKCFAGYMDGIIYSNGEVAFCEMLESIGNLRDFNYNFDKLWNSTNSIELKKKIRCHCVHPCNLSTSICLNASSLVKIFK